MDGTGSDTRALAHEALKEARALIADERDWCGNGWGGAETGGHDRCAWHALDTVERATDDQTLAEDALARAMGVERVGDIGEFNDSHTHAEVLAAFDRAIAATAPEGTTAPLPPEDTTPEPCEFDDVLSVGMAVDAAAATLADALAPKTPALPREDIYEYARGELWCAAQDIAKDCELIGKYEASGAPLDPQIQAALHEFYRDEKGE